MGKNKVPALLCGGGLRQDFLLTEAGSVRLGELGGNAVYAAVGAAVWTPDVGIWSRAGSNYPVEWLQRLQQAGLNVSGVKRLPGQHDHRTFYVYDRHGKRQDTDPASHFERIGRILPAELLGYVHSTPGQDDPTGLDPLALRPDDWTNACNGVRAVHLAPLPIRSHILLAEFLEGQGVSLLTIDPGERYMRPRLVQHIREILPRVSAFLPSEQEIETLFGRSIEKEQALRRLGAWGADIIVLKRGAKGIQVYLRDNDAIFTLPAYHAAGDERVVDPTGAGDAFCGGFIAGLSETGQPLAAARRGLVSSSLVVEGYGALYALTRTREEALNRLQVVEQRSNAAMNL